MNPKLCPAALESASKGQSGDPDLLNLGCVISDEIHYINDVERGSVWGGDACAPCASSSFPKLGPVPCPCWGATQASKASKAPKAPKTSM